MSDDEDYDSEEDFDYVPSEGEQGSEEENSGDEEDFTLLQDDDTSATKGSRRKQSAQKKNVIPNRKRKGGIKLEDKTEDGTAGISQGVECEEEAKRRKELAEQIAKEEEERRQEKERKRVEDLWSSFKSEVKMPVKSLPVVNAVSVSNQKQSVMEPETSVQPEAATGVVDKAKKVTITKVFDFAGEEIKITQEVDANSKEAIAEQKKQEKSTKEQEESSMVTSVSLGLKRPAVGGGLGSVLNKINKKNKMSTLEKSKMDWNSFKTKEGIEDDLKIHNKGKQGYTERMAFLSRADQRQFEIEKALRLGSTSKR